MAALGLTLLPSLAYASDYCTKEQYERDQGFIESAITAGTLAKGPKGLRDSMLVHEGFWFDMSYLEQIAFMQRMRRGRTEWEASSIHGCEVACHGQVVGDLDTWNA